MSNQKILDPHTGRLFDPNPTAKQTKSDLKKKLEEYEAKYGDGLGYNRKKQLVIKRLPKQSKFVNPLYNAVSGVRPGNDGNKETSKIVSKGDPLWDYLKKKGYVVRKAENGVRHLTIPHKILKKYAPKVFEGEREYINANNEKKKEFVEKIDTEKEYKMILELLLHHQQNLLPNQKLQVDIKINFGYKKQYLTNQSPLRDAQKIAHYLSENYIKHIYPHKQYSTPDDEVVNYKKGGYPPIILTLIAEPNINAFEPSLEEPEWNCVIKAVKDIVPPTKKNEGLLHMMNDYCYDEGCNETTFQLLSQHFRLNVKVKSICGKVIFKYPEVDNKHYNTLKLIYHNHHCILYDKSKDPSHKDFGFKRPVEEVEWVDNLTLDDVLAIEDKGTTYKLYGDKYKPYAISTPDKLIKKKFYEYEKYPMCFSEAGVQVEKFKALLGQQRVITESDFLSWAVMDDKYNFLKGGLIRQWKPFPFEEPGDEKKYTIFDLNKSFASFKTSQFYNGLPNTIKATYSKDITEYDLYHLSNKELGMVLLTPKSDKYYYKGRCWYPLNVVRALMFYRKSDILKIHSLVLFDTMKEEVVDGLLKIREEGKDKTAFNSLVGKLQMDEDKQQYITYDFEEACSLMMASDRADMKVIQTEKHGERYSITHKSFHSGFVQPHISAYIIGYSYCKLLDGIDMITNLYGQESIILTKVDSIVVDNDFINSQTGHEKYSMALSDDLGGWKIEDKIITRGFEIYNQQRFTKPSSTLLQLESPSCLDWPSYDTRPKYQLKKLLKKHNITYCGESIINITGHAGSGKSYTFTNLMSNLVMLSTTGMSADDIGGITYHRFKENYKIYFKKYASKEEFNIFKKHIPTTLFRGEMIFVDESSMMCKGHFDTMHHIAKDMRKVLILCGDPGYQLGAFNSLDFTQSKFYKEMDEAGEILHIEFTENHRQKDDPEFFEELMKLRDKSNEMCGLNPKYDCKKIAQKVKNDKYWSRFLREASVGVLKLCSTNAQCDEYNMKVMDTLEGEYEEVVVKQVVGTSRQNSSVGLTPTEAEQEVFEEWLLGHSKIKSGEWVERTIKIKDGAPFIVLKNSDEAKNGQRGVYLSSKEPGKEGGKWMLFYGTDKEKEIYKRGMPHVRVAYAMTIHKAQGITLDEPFMLSLLGHFINQMFYVGVSRATKSSLLHLVE